LKIIYEYEKKKTKLIKHSVEIGEMSPMATFDADPDPAFHLDADPDPHIIIFLLLFTAVPVYIVLPFLFLT
jgi:hypothetical protein